MAPNVHQARRGGSIVGAEGDVTSGSCTTAAHGEACASSPLIAAVSKGQLIVVKYLLSRGTDPTTAVDCGGTTALHLACANGNLALVNTLLAAAATAEPRRREKSFVNALDCNSSSTLHIAVCHGFLDIVEVLLDHGADTDAKDPECTPLYIACMLSHVAIARVLITRGAKLDLSFTDGQTLLHRVAGVGSLAIARLLLDSGADINALDKLNTTPLMNAAIQGRLAMVELLVARGAQTGLTKGQSAISAAATYGHLSIVQFFIGLYGREVVDQHHLLHCAIAIGVVRNVEYLLSLRPDLEATNKDGLTPLCSAICCLDLELVELLVANGADVHAKDVANHEYSYLHVAAEVKNADAIRFLLTRGLSVHVVDDQGGTALHVAAAVGAVEVLQVLLECGGNLFAETHDGFSVTQAAASNGKLKVLKLLEASGLMRDFEKHHASNATITPLSLAAGSKKACSSGVVQYLIEYQDRQRCSRQAVSSEASDKSSTKSTSAFKRAPLTASQRLYRSDALICAVQAGHLEIVKYLCDHGASINLLQQRGATALLTAAEFGHVDILEYLLEEKVPALDDVDYDGLAAIHYAAKNGHVRVIELLLAHGALVDERTDPLPEEELRFTETVAIHFAATHGHFDVLKMLINHGADLEIPNANGRRTIQLVRLTRSGSELPGAVGFLLTNGTVDEYSTIGDK